MKNMLIACAAVLAVGIMGSCVPPPAGVFDDGAARATNYYQCWTNGVGTASCTRNGDYMTASWSNIGDIVAGLGYNPCNSATMTWTGSCTNCNYWGVYGWLSTPITEYYIGRGGGTTVGTYSTSRGSYTLQSYSCNGPNITGNGYFVQFNCSGAGSSPINLGEHFTGWRNLGKTVTTQNYCIVAAEAWGGSTGNATISIGSTSTTPTTPTTSKTIVVRARGTSGSEHIKVTVNGTQYGAWTIGTSLANWQCSTTASGGLNVYFDNDASGRDVQIDYVSINGTVRQAEAQSTNTGVWNGSSCGGSYSEWLHCNGYIGFGNI